MQYTGYVIDMKVWDPDGAGPQQPVLVVAGGFDFAGGPAGLRTGNLAMWNGTTWQAFPVGISPAITSYAAVQAVEVLNGQLYIAGRFLVDGNPNPMCVARWSGSTWDQVGGAHAASGTTNPMVWDLHVHNNELFSVGNYVSIGGSPVFGASRWNGSAWVAMSPGNTPGDADWLYCLGSYAGSLYVGGQFSSIGGVPADRIARWTGSSWAPLPASLPRLLSQTNYINDIIEFNGELFITGKFTDPAAGSQCSNVAAWNGASWRYPDCGIWADDYFDRIGSTLHVHNNELYVGGYFDTAGGDPAWCIARFNGTSWSNVGPGLNGQVPVGWGTSGVMSLATYQGNLYAGGSIFNSGEARLDGIARWNGSAWLGVSNGVVREPFGGVLALAPWGGRMIAGGNFYVHDPVRYGVYGMYSWDGVRMNGDIGGTSQFSIGSLPARAMVSYTRTVGVPSNDLYVGGDFTNIGAHTGGSGAYQGIAANRIATRNDLLGTGWEPMGAGFNNSVYAITRFNGSIHAAGTFTASGTTTVNRIARWTGSAWTPLTTFPTSSPDNCNGPVYAMKAYSSGVSNIRLVIGGDFTTCGGLNVNRVIQYNASSISVNSSWSALGAGFNGPVQALEFYSGSIYAGGSFSASGATPVSNIARWNGSAWVSVGSGINGPVYAMTISNGTLVVGGDFTNAGGITCNNLARWNGSAWAPIGGGTDGPVRALSVWQNELHVGGYFTTVRNGVMESAQWARYSETGIPWIAQQPTPVSANCGGTARITFEPAAGYGGLTYQWYKDNVPLQLGPTGNGSSINGAGTSLTIAHFTPADRGVYWCVLGNACGSVESVRVNLTPTGSCPVQCDRIDFNRDDLYPDTLDIQDFLDVFAGGVCAGQTPGSPACNNDVDFNNDGLFPDTDDVQSMLSVFAGGSCL